MDAQTINMMPYGIDHIISNSADGNRILVHHACSGPCFISQILKKDNIRPIKICKFFEQISDSD